MLRDATLDATLRSAGWVDAGSLLHEAEVAEVVRQYEALAPTGEDGLVIDFMRVDRRASAALQALARRAIAPVVDRLFSDHRVAVSTFIMKHPGDASAMPFHEEPTFVDDAAERALNLWIPMAAVGPEVPNGALELVPGSELIDPRSVGFTSPPWYLPYVDALSRHVLVPPVAPGGGLVYDARMLHRSGPNRSSVPRLALAASVVPRTSPLVHVVATGRTGRRVHSVDEAFFVRTQPGEVQAGMPPEWPVSRTFAESRRVDFDRLGELLGRPEREVARVVLPADVAPSAGLLPTRAPLLRPLAADLEFDLDHVRPVTGRLPRWCRLDRASGAVRVRGTAEVARHPLMTVSGDVWVPTTSLRSPRRSPVVLELAPGGRAELSMSGRRPTRLAVLDAPDLMAGVWTASGAANLEVGVDVEVPSDDSRLLFWNDGPGAVAVVLIPSSWGRGLVSSARGDRAVRSDR